jgi:hypothetical protein
MEPPGIWHPIRRLEELSMKISQARVDLRSDHHYRETRALTESLQLFARADDGQSRRVSIEQGSRVSLSTQALALAQRVTRQDPTLANPLTGAGEGPAPSPTLTPGAPPASPWPTAGAARSGSTDATDNATPRLNLDSRSLLIKQIIEQISGRAIRLVEPIPPGPTPASAPPTPSGQPPAAPPAERAAEFGMQYHRTRHYSEQEQTRFGAVARVTTADGRQITLQLELTLERQFVSDSHLEIRAGVQLRDPLVINLGGGPVQLGTRAEGIDFDLDADGQRERIAFVTGTSGFLALDRDGDGTLNDGRELFGALSGNGFDDLAAYDSDGNGFIDAGDPVFEQLRIWVRDAGEERLLVLADQGVGALYLGYSDTPFALKDAQNRVQGMIRNTGVYLNETGRGGTLQQIDLVT